MCPTGTSLSQAADLRSAFEILDVDHDGKISHDDLKTFYADAADDVIGTMMTVADSNKDGYVEFDEFENVLKNNNNNNNNRDGMGGVMEDVFNAMDRDGDGKVGHEDLRSYLRSAGMEVKEDDIRAMVHLGGGDATGVTFEGFLRILLLAAV